MKKIALVFLSALLIAVVAFGCAARSASDLAVTQNSTAERPSNEASEKDYAGGGEISNDGKAAPEAIPAPAKDLGSVPNGAAPAADPSRKMIWTGETELETTDFDTSLNALNALIGECGGYIQSSAVTGEGRTANGEKRLRNGRFSVRVPDENFQLFMKGSGNLATVIYSNTGAEDVTSYYYDTEAHLKVLKIKEERLIEMLAATKDAAYADQLQYILQIENELANVRYEIENLTGTLKHYDDLISYSTVTVYMNEVEALSATPAAPESLGKRIAQQFTSSMLSVIKAGGNLIVWFIGNLPVLIVLAAIGAGVYFLVRIIFRRKKKNSTDIQ